MLRIAFFCNMRVPDGVNVFCSFGGTYCIYLQRSVRTEAASYSKTKKISAMLLRNLTILITWSYDGVLHYCVFKEHHFWPWCTLKEECLPFCRQFIQNCICHINAIQFDVYCVTSSCTELTMLSCNVMSVDLHQLFYVFLTVHPGTTLRKWPTWCTITLYKTFIIITLYMFRVTLCSSSGGRVVLIQHLV